jgi:hypothetical protein
VEEVLFVTEFETLVTCYSILFKLSTTESHKDKENLEDSDKVL